MKNFKVIFFSETVMKGDYLLPGIIWKFNLAGYRVLPTHESPPEPGKFSEYSV